MKKNTLLSIFATLILFSCKAPQNYGVIYSQMDPVCKRKFFIENTSTDQNITFVIKGTEIRGNNISSLTDEQTVGPKEVVLLGCDGTVDSLNYEIVSAYVNNK